MIKSTMDYLESDAELDILKLKSVPSGTLKQVLTSDELRSMKEEVSAIYAETVVLRYIRDLARATREMEELELGLSPRGAIHLLLTSKAHAYLAGRDYLIPDDVKAMAHKVINHRLILTPEAELEGATKSGITDKVLSSVPVPKEDVEDELPEE
jgi:MoxR-like ATPase